MRTPREDGLRMPAEWSPQEATLMEWPTNTWAELWGELSEARAASREGVELVPVPGRTIHEGGGGPHCITQQVPRGVPLL